MYNIPTMAPAIANINKLAIDPENEEALAFREATTKEVLAFVHYFKECVTAEDCDKHLKSISHNQIMVVAWILIKEHLYNDAIKSALW